MNEEKICKSCGQSNIGQTGEYPCKVCKLPTTWDSSFKKEHSVQNNCD